MTEESLKPLYLLTGNDRAKITRALERLKKRFGSGSEEQVSAWSASGAEVAQLLRSFSLGADRRLVIVKECERWKKEDCQELEQYLENPDPDALLLLLGKPAARSALVALVAQHGELLNYTVASAPRFIAAELKREGCSITKGAVKALVELRGSEPDQLLPELCKLADYADGEPIDEGTVRALVAASDEEVSAYALRDAWGDRNLPGLLKVCERLSAERREEWVVWIAGLSGHIRRTLICKALPNARAAAARLSLHPYAAEKAFQHARHYSTEELQSALLRLSKLDDELKGGSLLPPLVLVERALIEII